MTAQEILPPDQRFGTAADLLAYFADKRLPVDQQYRLHIAWQRGDLSGWPDYSDWLERRRERSGSSLLFAIFIVVAGIPLVALIAAGLWRALGW